MLFAGPETLHNLGVVAQICDHVGVMYAGNIVQTAELSTCSAARPTLTEETGSPQMSVTRACVSSSASASSGRSATTR